MGLRGTWARTVGGLPAAFWWLWAGPFLNRVGSFVLTFLAFYLTDALGHYAAYAGLVLALFGLGSAVAAVVGGVLADRIGRRPTLLGSFAASSVVMAALGFVQSPAAIAVGALLLGLASNATRPAFSAMVSDLVGPEDRVRAFSLNYWAINLGFAIAPVLAGLLAGFGYRTLFLADAATTALTALLLWAKLPETRPARAAGGAAEPAALQGTLRDALGDRVFGSFVLLTFLIAAVYAQHQITLPIAMRDDGLSPAAYGSVMAVNGILIVLVTVPVSRWLQRLPPERVLAAAAVITGAGFACTAAADSATAHAAAVAVWTVGEILNAPVSVAVVAALAPAHLRGRYQGVYTLAWSAAFFLAPLVGGWTYEVLGGDALWLACGAAGLVCAAGHLVIAGARDRRLAELAPQTA